MVTVTNTSKQLVTVILDHPAFANKESGWQRAVVQVANQTESGARVITEARRSFPGSLTLLPGQSVQELHPAISKIPQVAELVQRRVLSIKQDEPQQQVEAKTK